MTRWSHIIVFWAAAVTYANSQECNILGHYWKDISKELPNDAFEAGIDGQGRPLFIGQSVIEDKMLPGKIYTHEPILYVSNNDKEESIQKRVKVLCSKQTESFEWKNEKIDKNTNLTMLVIGGHVGNTNVYIGRIKHGEEMLVGKVVAEGKPPVWKFYVTSGGESFPYETYNVLFFNGERP